MIIVVYTLRMVKNFLWKKEIIALFELQLKLFILLFH